MTIEEILASAPIGFNVQAWIEERIREDLPGAMRAFALCGDKHA